MKYARSHSHVCLCISTAIAALLLSFELLPLTAQALGDQPDPGHRSYSSRIRTRPNDLTGSLTYSIDLKSPPGRNGLEPNLKLTYDSANTDLANWFGQGWSINIPYVERINKRGTDKLYSTTTPNYFFSSLSGELATTTSSTAFAAKVDDGSFIQYTFSSNVWTATDKMGNIYEFGSTTVSRQDNADSSLIYKWMLNEIRDTNNNYIKYEYTKDSGQIYPSKITYTGNGTTDGPFEVEFVTESRSDFATSSTPAFPVVTHYRISEIRAEIDNTWVRKYSLSYTAGNNGIKSLLSSVTESGRDESGNVSSLPENTFSYATSTVGWTTDGTWSFPTENLDEDGVRVADVNGDSLPDVLWSNNCCNPSISKTYLNSGGGGWSEAGDNWDPPVWLNVTQNPGPGFAELNGDGLIDAFRKYQSNNVVILNTGNGWWQHPTWQMPGDVEMGDQGAVVTDVNADGLADVLYSNETQSINKAFINDGQGGWTDDPAWYPTISMDYAQVYGTGIAELNGDGLPDLFRKWDSVNIVHLNDGNGWTEATGWSMPDASFGNSGVELHDVNGDGLDDVVAARWQSSERKTFLNNGDGTWEELPAWDFSVESGNYLNQSAGMVDLNGDGLVDTFEKNTIPNPDEESVNINNTHTRVDILTRVQTSSGGIYTYEYKGSPQYASGGKTLNPDLPFTLITVSAIGENDGLGTIGTTTYSYRGGDYYYGSLFDRRLAGFASTTKTDPDGNITATFYHQGTSTYSGLGKYLDHSSKIGQVFRVENQNSSGSTYKKEIIKWENIVLGNSGLQNERNFVQQTRKTVLDYDGDADHKDKAETYSYSTTTGNLKQKVQWGEVTTSSDNGDFVDTGTDKLTTDITYALSAGSNVTARSSTETLTNQSSSTVAQTRRYYDSLVLGGISKGNETKTEQLKSGSSYASTTKVYNLFGLVATSTDGRGNATGYRYDARNLYVGTSTNALSQQTQYLYDYASGKIKQTTDPNSRVFQTVYDGLGRATTVKQPDIASPSSLVTKTTFAYTDNTVPTSILETNYLNAASSTLNYSYFDGLKRLRQERSEAEGVNSYATKDRTYNSRGLLASESFPYFSSGSSYTAPSGTAALFTRYTYDPLGRVTATANAVGTTTTAYDDWKMTVTDAEDEIKHLYDDAYGNLVRVDEVATTTFTTTYTYNGLNKLATTTDANGNVRGFTYDGRGLRLSAEDLHAPSDSTFGKWFYFYDDEGNVGSTTDPKSQNVVYTYDALNRVLTENVGLGAAEISYGYDSCAEGKGRLCVATTTDAISSYAYNALGLPSSETKKIRGTNYTTSYSYDRQGNLTDLTYPDTSAVRYTYNDAGFVEEVSRKPATASGYLQALSKIDYAPIGAISYKKFANGVESTYSYDANALYRLTNIFTVASSTWSGGGPLGLLDYGNLPWRSMLAKAFPQLLAIEADPLGESILLPESTTTPQAETPASEQATTSSQEIILSEEPVTSTPEFVSATTTPEVAETTLQESAAAEITQALPVETVIVPEQALVEPAQKGPYKEKDDRYELELGEQGSGAGRDSVEILKEGPEIRLKKWGDEVNLGVSYAGVEAPASQGDSGDRIEWKGEKEEVHAYPVALDGDSGFEFEVYLKEKPATNVFEFPVEGADGLDFFYQAPLNEETHEGLTCTETGCTDAEGNIVLSRPENVIDSYAVYHTSKKDHRAGETNYATGKAFHIFRPKAIDANGDEVWGTLSYKDGTLAVEVPQEFLDAATYPVRVDPTFGYTSVGASSAVPGGGNAVASLFASPSDYGSIDSMSIYCDKETSGTVGIKTGVWLDSDLTIRGYSNAATCTNGSPGWQTPSFASSPSLSASTDYILGGVMETSRTRVFYDSGSADQGHLDSSNSYATPADMVSATHDTNKFSVYITYTASGGGNNAPIAPTSLLAEGQTNPTNISDSTPEFSAIYNDLDSGDQANKYRIQVATTTTFSSTFWDSGTTTMATTTAGNRSPDISYGGSALASSTTYYWRIAFTDDSGAHGIWSTTTATFSLAASGGGGGNPFATILQNIFYTYDKVGNIKNIDDYSDTGAGKRVAYGYDELYRLTSAVTSAASSTSFSDTYSYNALGNIFNFDGTSYEYGGYLGSSYANPHAATAINGIAQTYDNNGNLTSASPWTYTWDYRNRLASTTNGTATTTFGYDHENQRVFKKVGSNATTTYANKYYNIAGATTTVHLFLPDGDLLATVETGSASGGSGSATSTGFKTTGTVEVSTGWSNFTTTRVNTSDDSRASCTSVCDDNDDAQTSDYTFGIPADGTIDGIEVSIEANESLSTGNIPLDVSLSWNDGTSFTSTKTATVDGTSDATYTLGGAADTWGRSWDDAEFANGTFRARFDKQSTSDTLNVDQIRIKVYYTTQGSSGSSATTTRYIHTDHLGGTNVTSDENGLANEIVDFYPYGAERFRDGDSQDQRQFAGTERDQESNLDYMINRYYSSNVGKFLSEDPTFLAVGGPDLADKMGLPQSNDQEKRNEGALRAFLLDPQLGNSYSYGRNNPITNTDPNGNCGLPCLAIAVLAGIFLDVDTAHAPTVDQDLSELSPSPFATGLNVIGFVAAPGKGALSAAGKYFQKEGVELTSHALQRVVQRADQGITPEGVVNALRNGERFTDKLHNNTVFLKDGIRVSVDNNNVVRTVVTESRDLNKVDRFIKVKE